MSRDFSFNPDSLLVLTSNKTHPAITLRHFPSFYYFSCAICQHYFSFYLWLAKVPVLTESFNISVPSSLSTFRYSVQIGGDPFSPIQPLFQLFHLSRFSFYIVFSIRICQLFTFTLFTFIVVNTNVSESLLFRMEQILYPIYIYIYIYL